MGKPRREYVYGINPAFEVLRAGRRTLYGACLSRSADRNPRVRKLERLLTDRKIPLEWVERGRVRDLAESKDHQGVVLKTSPYPYVPLADMLDRDKLLLLDNVEDPHNVGAILRSAEIFGFHHVLIPRKGTPEIYPSVLKVSAGAAEFLSITREGASAQYVRTALDHGFAVVALDAKGKVSLEDDRLAGLSRLLLVVGGEDHSVGQFILNHATHVAAIPQQGRVNSLNASVAAAIGMYELRRRP